MKQVTLYKPYTTKPKGGSEYSLVVRLDSALEEMSIRQYNYENEDEFRIELGVLMESLIILLGAKEPSDLERRIMRETIVKNYGELTLSELKIAIEMAFAGKLVIGDVLQKKTFNLNMVLLSTIFNGYRSAKHGLHKKVIELKESQQELELYFPDSPKYKEEMANSTKRTANTIVKIYSDFLKSSDTHETSVGNVIKKAGFGMDGYIRDFYFDILRDFGFIELSKKQEDEFIEQDQKNTRGVKSMWKKQLVKKTFKEWKKQKLQPSVVYDMILQKGCVIDPWKVEELIGFTGLLKKVKESNEYLVVTEKKDLKRAMLTTLPFPEGLEKVQYNHFRNTVVCFFNGVRYENRTVGHFRDRYNVDFVGMFVHVAKNGNPYGKK